MNWRSLRTRTIIIVSAICTLLFTILYFYSSKEISARFSELETTEAKINLLRVQDTLTTQGDNMLSKLSDWGQWDDCYKYVKDLNQNFVEANLMSGLGNLKFNYFSIWNSDKKLLWGNHFNLQTEDETKKMYPASENDLAYLQKINLLFEHKTPEDNRYIFILLEGEPYLMASVAITSTDGKSPINGSVIVGVKLDGLFFKNLSKQLHLEIENSKLPSTTISNEDLNIIKILKNSDLQIRIKNNQLLEILSIIKDYASENLILIKLNIPRTIHLQSQKTLSTFMKGMFISGFILVIIMLMTINGLVITRVLRLSEGMKKVKDTGDLKQKIASLGEDEIGQLANSFNQMLEEVEKLRETSLHNEKLASLGEMAGGIAHEINNPIAIISGSTNILKKLFAKGITEQEKYLKQIDDIDKTIIRISKIVNGLKNVSRDANNETFSNCLIYDPLNDALSVCSEKFKIGGVKIIINLDDPIFQTSIPCLQVQLSQVFFNILGNSFDAVEKDASPWVKISATTSDNMLIIRCEDSGLGIPKEIQSKIFQPFYTTKVVGKGTGLGLSLCNTIIKNHGGEFLIDNDSKNTCFIIKLPKNGKINE